MAKLTLSDVTNLGGNPVSAQGTINANSTSIEAALENTLSRDGTTPNEMDVDLDMNSNRILNLPVPVSATEPLRLQDLSDFTGGGSIITGAPTNATYVTLGTNGTLSAERVLTAGTGIALDDAGAGSTATIRIADGDRGDIVITSSGGTWTLDPVTGTGSFVRAGSPTLTGTLNLSGGQITFPSTQSASGNANTLDDYEEGSWTPVLTAATPGNLSVSYALQTGTYTKIGNMVAFKWAILTSAFTHTSASGNLMITGLPFVVSSFATAPVAFQGLNLDAGYTQVVTNMGEGSTTGMVFYRSGDNVGISTVQMSEVPTGGTVALRSSGVYFV